ncbi:hypothetical protein GALL_444620 [mine drainage metagenome]|uniref:Uncharacterized protein n=1 Tax=mine drainage metagenome TaxID=410659 RepID=A0A1J5PQM7_9ZZZZ
MVCDAYPGPLTVTVYVDGTGRFASTNVPTWPEVTVEAVRVVVPSVAVTVSPPRPLIAPSASGPVTVPANEATPCVSARLTTAVPPAVSDTSCDCAPKPVPAAVTR